MKNKSLAVPKINIGTPKKIKMEKPTANIKVAINSFKKAGK